MTRKYSTCLCGIQLRSDRMQEHLNKCTAAPIIRNLQTKNTQLQARIDALESLVMSSQSFSSLTIKDSYRNSYNNVQNVQNIQHVQNIQNAQNGRNSKHTHEIKVESISNLPNSPNSPNSQNAQNAQNAQN